MSEPTQPTTSREDATMPTTLDEARGVDAGILEDAATVLQLLDRQPRVPAVSADLPGRAVDIAHAAARRINRTPYSIRWNTEEGINLALSGGVDEATGRAVFATLGAADAILGDRYGGGPQANLAGYVPALGMQLSIIIDDLPPQLEPTDPTALIAEVDAARAAADDEADEDGAAHRALVAGLLGALADSQAAIDARAAADEQDGGEGE